MTESQKAAQKGGKIVETTETTEATQDLTPEEEAQKAEAEKAEAEKAEAAKKAEAEKAAQAQAWAILRNQTPTVEGLGLLKALADNWANELRDSILAKAREALAAVQDTPFYVLSNSERRNVIATHVGQDVRFYGASAKLGVKGPYQFDPGSGMMMAMMLNQDAALLIRGDGDALPTWTIPQLLQLESLAMSLGPETLAALREADPVLSTRAHRVKAFYAMFSGLAFWPMVKQAEAERQKAEAIEAAARAELAEAQAQGRDL